MSVQRYWIMLLALALGACASTTLESVWKQPDYAGPAVRKVMVMGVSEDATIRRAFEDEFSGQLRARGLEAVPSYTEIPADGKVDREQIRRALGRVGADSVLITRLVRLEKETVVTPAVYSPAYTGSFYGYYGNAWTYQPSVYQYNVATVETNLWNVASEQMIWSATTRTFDPERIRNELPEFSRLLVDSLAGSGLL
jgi:hypothetical protein